MSFEDVLYRAFSLGLFVVGLSHLLQAGRWAGLLRDAKRSPHAAFIIGLMFLPIGLLLVAGHNVWTRGPRVVVTVYGWVLVLKCVTYLLWPRVLDRVSPSDPARATLAFRFIGAVMTLLGAFLAYYAFFAAGPRIGA